MRLLLGIALLVVFSGCDVTDNGQPNFSEESDPLSLDLPIAYIQRPLPVDEDGEPAAFELLDPTAFHPGAELVIKDRAQASAQERIITAGLFPPMIAEDTGEPIEPLYDVKDLTVSSDGEKLLFAMRAPEIEDADDDEQPTWNIWEYEIATDSLRRIIPSDIIAEQGHDVSPHYLPDGRIVFSSTRQLGTRAMLLGIYEDKPAYSALDDGRDEINTVLHIMDPNGDNLAQLSYNASQDMQPSVMASGDLLFLRRDAIGNKDGISLYRSKPDGSDVQVYYGYHNQDTGTNDSEAILTHPMELPDGRILAILQPRDSLRLGGDIVAVDAVNYVEFDQPVRSNPGGSGPAQRSLTLGNVDTEGDQPSLGGYFSSAYPLRDGTQRLLVSWSQCRLINPNADGNSPCTQSLIDTGAEQAPPLFGLWIYDTIDKTQLPVKIPESGIMYTDAVVIAERPPNSAAETVRNQDLAVDQVGSLHIRSVYDMDGLDSAPNGGIAVMADPAQTPVDSRPIRFIRIVKNVPLPDEDVLDFDNAIFGRRANQGMRDIVGYVPVEPDGSAKFKVPANMPIMLDLLDAAGKRVGRRHENWIYVRPGEERECTGCHTPNSQVPHGRRDAESDSAWMGSSGVAFANSRLTDELGTQINTVPEIGETMAEYYARVHETPRTPSMDLIFVDEWTNPALATPGQDISLRYLDIDSEVNRNPYDDRCGPREPAPAQWNFPTACTTVGSWSTDCRTTINYIEHIHPLWEADRRRCDDASNVVANATCIDCHTRGPVDAAMIPAGQLELTGEVSIDQNEYITSYAELFFEDNELELVDNALTDRVDEMDTGEFETDAEGNLIRDENGNPIPIIDLVTYPVTPAMSTNGANASNRFFSRFEQGGSHFGYLSQDELKLIAEWLDIGGQYYNNPFKAPAN